MSAPDGTAWPSADDDTAPAGERAKSLFQARVDAVAAARQAALDHESETHKDQLARTAALDAARTDEDKAAADAIRATAAASRAANLANLQSFSDNLSALAVGAVERSRAGAEVVQKASAAIVTLYTGLLGFVFVASDNPLPARGVLAPVFLGLAVVLSTAYLAYVNATDDVSSGPVPVQGVEPKVIARLNAIVEAASKLATRRSYLLRASVIALGVGLVYIALPFLSIGSAPPATPGGGPSIAAWPTPTAGIPDNLNAIVYQAQVDEVATARTAAADAASTPAAVDDTMALAALAAVGLLATFGVPKLWTPS